MAQISKLGASLKKNKTNYMDEKTTKILLAILAIIATIVGGAIYSKTKNKTKKYNVTQKDININGDNNKIVGGDNKSIK